MTLKIVLAGFLILILIMACIWGFILWDRNKTESQNGKTQLNITGNSAVNNENLQTRTTASNPSNQ